MAPELQRAPAPDRSRRPAKNPVEPTQLVSRASVEHAVTKGPMSARAAEDLRMAALIGDPFHGLPGHEEIPLAEDDIQVIPPEEMN